MQFDRRHSKELFVRKQLNAKVTLKFFPLGMWNKYTDWVKPYSLNLAVVICSYAWIFNAFRLMFSA